MKKKCKEKDLELKISEMERKILVLYDKLNKIKNKKKRIGFIYPQRKIGYGNY